MLDIDFWECVTFLCSSSSPSSLSSIRTTWMTYFFLPIIADFFWTTSGSEGIDRDVWLPFLGKGGSELVDLDGFKKSLCFLNGSSMSFRPIPHKIWERVVGRLWSRWLICVWFFAKVAVFLKVGLNYWLKSALLLPPFLVSESEEST